MEFELVAEGLQFPEGPIAMADGSVILTEIQGRRLTRIRPDGSRETVVETGGGPNGAAIGPDGAIWITNNGGSFVWIERDGLTIPGPTPPEHAGGMIQRYDLTTGELRTVYDSCDGKRLIGPNDLVFDRQGGFWFTDHGCSTPDGRKFGALYYARTDGSHISRQRDHIISPNGVGLSPDETVVYVADTQLGRLWAFDVAEPGVLAPPPGFAPGRIVANLPGYQLLDSLAVEASGKVCVATIINGGITAFDPDGSTEHFAFPDLICTNICFGGPDMQTAWITASSTGKLFRARWPRPGLRLNFNG
ncbi:SMP-30/gluconolactonase/LRE family protein [Phenylobacterium sp.]|jgi:gluconolactonase|uniref:SMP-30/gluconolactonase/LRE family protein n=1 Tax=Phenylobacterium sp. TaxID=1871053 RepID=UPI002F95EF2E